MAGRVVENIQKNQKLFKIAKMPKLFPKVSKRVLNMFWGDFSEKVFLLGVPWRVELSKNFKKIKNFSKLQKRLKVFPKVFKRVLDMFWVNISKNFFAQCSMEARVVENFQKNQKIFKIPKMS